MKWYQEPKVQFGHKKLVYLNYLLDEGNEVEKILKCFKKVSITKDEVAQKAFLEALNDVVNSNNIRGAVCKSAFVSIKPELGESDFCLETINIIGKVGGDIDF